MLMVPMPPLAMDWRRSGGPMLSLLTKQAAIRQHQARAQRHSEAMTVQAHSPRTEVSSHCHLSRVSKHLGEEVQQRLQPQMRLKRDETCNRQTNLGFGSCMRLASAFPVKCSPSKLEDGLVEAFAR
mmetsp:Transcript_43808/g.106386  ORF Transcript_43808/g.106386 Transcript_43808/m.106386 type:complete len:126 (+) Transcript_43808:1039-1416(+)